MASVCMLSPGVWFCCLLTGVQVAHCSPVDGSRLAPGISLSTQTMLYMLKVRIRAMTNIQLFQRQSQGPPLRWPCDSPIICLVNLSHNQIPSIMKRKLG